MYISIPAMFVRMNVAFVVVLAFVAGFFVVLNNRIYRKEFQTMSEGLDSSCPSFLVKQNNQYKLISNGEPDQEITFSSLEMYENYVKDQEAKGIHCPTLYAQEVNGIQGSSTFHMYPSPAAAVEGGTQNVPIQTMELPKKGIPSPPLFSLNDHSYPGFDAHGLYVGKFTDVDRVHTSTATKDKMSENPMDTNWGEVQYTQQAIDKGTYKENEVKK